MTFSKEEMDRIAKRTPQQLEAENKWWRSLSKNTQLEILEAYAERERHGDFMKGLAVALLLAIFVAWPLIALIGWLLWPS